MGSGIAFSISFGERDIPKLKSDILHSFILIFPAAVLINIIAFAGLDPIMTLLRVPDEVVPFMREYLAVIFVGIIATFLYNYFASLLRAVGNSIVPLIFLGVSALLNVGLDLLFIFAFDMGVGGAAWATVIAQYVSGIGAAVYTLAAFPEYRISRGETTFDSARLKGIAGLSLMTSVQQSVMNFGILMVQGLVNSFGAVYRAIQYEANRQMEELEKGGVIEQETRRWDDAKGVNFVLRTKEDAQDYRYFPEPDLLTFVLSEEHVQKLKDSVPELPVAKTLRYVKEFGLNQADAELLASSKQRSAFFDACVAFNRCDKKALSNWMIGDVARILNERRIEIDETYLTPEKLTAMVELIENKTISNTAAKTVLEEMFARDCQPKDVVEEKGLAQVSDTGALAAIVKDVLASQTKAVEDYKNGKTNVLGFLVGQCMKASKGQGNPAILREMMEQEIAKL